MARRLRLASGPRATVAEIWSWGAESLGFLGILQCWSFGDDGGPVLTAKATRGGTLSLVRLPFSSKTGIAITRKSLIPLFSPSPALESPRTLFLCLSSYQT